MIARVAALACLLLWCALAPTAVAGGAKGKPKRTPEVDRRIAITIDDLPWQWAGRLHPDVFAARHAKLIAAVRASGVTGVGFVNEKELEVDGKVDPARVAMLREWLDAGWELGNHTWGHLDYHAVGLEAYEADVLKGERVLRPLLAERGETPKWFRHPWLRNGRTPEERAALDAFLAQHGYRTAPVTVNTGEWIWANAYQRTLDGVAPDAEKQATLARLRSEYVAYMLAKLAFLEQQSLTLLEYNVPQVLLLHANELNAETFPELIGGMQQHGYRVVSLEEAVRDPAYARVDGYRGPHGISWLHRWALAEGKQRSFFMGDTTVPRWVMDIAGVETE
ncbi:polysaccharide deacetylase family protein [Lysobacter sp. A6]|uniref:Polysaccharide deacetylase family protein n=1 Tax=Noviluteimonas lactosilytica TaxID=2888523 RepID=A0ABS8JH30_9GAMM|nr:polysaccharide deacetylase family protein [Lysobacter lactosilyticus]MCC8362860.1 polysaccharide deacetylase family protein [Lysobacter lactosilyticus]